MATKQFSIKEILQFQPKSRRKAGEGLESGPYPFFTSSQIQKRWCTDADYQKGSVILGTGGGASVHYSEQFSTSTDVFILAPSAEFISAKYVAYYLLGNKHILDKGFKGAGLKHISRKYVEAIQIPLPINKDGVPDIKEQKRIVALLEEAERLQKKRAIADQKMEEVIPALFNEMFGDLRKNDKQWPIIRFGEIGTSRLGKMLDSKKQTGKNKKPYIKNTNVKWGYFDLNNLPEMDFSDEEREEFRLKLGDLLICEGGEIGRTAIWKEDISECYFQKALHRVRLDRTKAIPEYIATLLHVMAKANYFRELTGTATIPHLTGVQLTSIKTPLPPIKLQKEFAEKVNKILELKTKQIESATKINNLFTSLLTNSITK